MSGQSATATPPAPSANPAPAAAAPATTPAPASAPAAPAVAAAAPAAPATTPAPAPATTPAPAEITLAAPQGSPLDAAHVEGLKAFAKEKGLSQAQAQALLEREHAMAASLPERFQRMDAERLAASQTQWEADALAKLASGDQAKLTALVEVAKKPLAKYAKPEFRALLDQTKLGSHPMLLEFLHSIGQAMAEDSPTTTTAGNGGAPAEPKTLADALYTTRK